MAKSKSILGDDPRTPKLLGVLLVFLSAYLFIACLSYCFTWKDDQDKVWHFSFNLLFQDIEVANLLGRLGAIVSDFFIFTLFGLPSFFIIFLLFQYGLGIINEVPLGRYSDRLRTSVIWMVGSSILLGFIFQLSDFPWGGNFGIEVNHFLIRFVGQIGTFLLIVLIILFLIIWTYNPELKGLTLQTLGQQLQAAILSIWDDRYRNATFSPKEIYVDWPQHLRKNGQKTPILMLILKKTMPKTTRT